MFSFFSPENRAVYEIMWKNMVALDGPQTTIWRMRISRYVPKATNTHSTYVILIAFHRNHGCTNAPQCSLCVHCLSCFFFNILSLSILSQNVHGQCNCRLGCVASCEATNTYLSTFGKNNALFILKFCLIYEFGHTHDI